MAVGVITRSEELTRIAGRAAEYFTLRYSRKQEYEADDLGSPLPRRGRLRPLCRRRHARRARPARAIYEPHPRPRRGAGDPRMGAHPSAGRQPGRAGRADQAAATGIADGALPELEAAYLGEVDGLLYGDDPRAGLRRRPALRPSGDADRLRGAAGLHPDQQPAGDPDRGAGRLARRVRRRADAAGRARGLCGRVPGRACCANARAEAGPVERTRVNGLPRSLLPVSWCRPSRARSSSPLAVYDGGDGGAYHFIMVAPPAEASRAAIAALFASFRLLSPEEAVSLRPRLIRTVRVGPGPDRREPRPARWPASIRSTIS